MIAGRYSLHESLGEGASAILYRAEDTRLGRDVALKRMRAPSLDARARERFLDEARTLATLRHPNLVHVYDAGEDEHGVPYVVMDLLEGRTLEQALRDDGVMGVREALELCLPLLGALVVAHEAGVLHRDIKPSNVFLKRRVDGSETPVLLDFGIAKRLEGPGHTTTGNVLGTPLYMAPEQATGHGLGPRTDVWSMGVLLFRCLSGQVPFEAPTAVGVLMKIVYETPPSVKDVNPQIPASIALCVDRAITRAPTRYDDVRTFARALASAAVLDGIDLPLAPDPVGLPSWADWVSTAQADETGAFARIDLESNLEETEHASPDAWITSHNPAASKGTSATSSSRRPTAATPLTRAGRTRGRRSLLLAVMLSAATLLGLISTDLLDERNGRAPTVQDQESAVTKDVNEDASASLGHRGASRWAPEERTRPEPDSRLPQAHDGAVTLGEGTDRGTSDERSASKRARVLRRSRLNMRTTGSPRGPDSASTQAKDGEATSKRPHIVTSWDL